MNSKQAKALLAAREAKVKADAESKGKTPKSDSTWVEMVKFDQKIYDFRISVSKETTGEKRKSISFARGRKQWLPMDAAALQLLEMFLSVHGADVLAYLSSRNDKKDIDILKRLDVHSTLNIA